MKLIKFLNLVIIFTFSFSFANAKPMPPGTGNAVPANILFLIDKSQSMHDHASGNNKTKNMRPPTDLAGRGDGNYFVSGVDESGFYYWNADQNQINTTKTIFKGNTWRAHAGKKNGMGSPVQIEYHVGKKLIYGLSDSRDIGMGSVCAGGGFVAYTIDPAKGIGTKKKKEKESVNYFTGVNTSRPGDFPVNGVTFCNKSPTDSNGSRPWVFLGKTAMAMHGNKLWLVTAETPNINDSSMNGMLVVDINSSASNLGWGTDFECTQKLEAYKYFNESIDVVEEEGDLYMYSKDNTSRAGQILKQKLDADGCIDTSSGPQYTSWNNSANADQCGSSNKGGASIVVKNKIIYTTGYFTHTAVSYTHLTLPTTPYV